MSANRKIERPEYRSPGRILDYLETYMRNLETAGYIFTPSEIARLQAIYERLHRALVKLNDIPPEDYPYILPDDSEGAGIRGLQF